MVIVRKRCYVMLCYASSWSKEARGGQCKLNGVGCRDEVNIDVGLRGWNRIGEKKWQDRRSRYRAGQGGRKGARALRQSRKGRRQPQVRSSGTPTGKDWSWRM